MASLMAFFKSPVARWNTKRFHDFFTGDGRLEIVVIFLLDVFQFLHHDIVVGGVTLDANFILEVMSARHRIIRASMPSPASN